ncbi:aminotransferase [Gemmatimonadetes bacterium T265]|nr:aminotransferase [Gemmatimonadetes bacterium T265]
MTTPNVVPNSSFGTFFLPGPTEVRPEVLAAMTRPMIAHRGAAFEALYARCDAGLRRVFKTARPVFISSSSATGLMEAAVRCARPGPVLAVVNGAFSERFAEIARACGREVDVLAVPFGRAADPDDVARQLSRRAYAAVTVAHSETSSGALTDVVALGAAARAHGARMLVDSVTALGAAPLDFDASGLDFVLTGSQKALALPPGLAFAAVGEGYLAEVGAAPDRGRYFDVAEFAAFAAKRQTPNTPALSLFYALEAQLARTVGVDAAAGAAAALAPEPVEARWARHAALAAQTWAWAEACGGRFGIAVLAPEGERSPTVSAITLPTSVAPAAVVAAVARRGYVVGGGYGAGKGSTFRIGHMGDHTAEGLAGCLAACTEALAEIVGR